MQTKASWRLGDEVIESPLHSNDCHGIIHPCALESARIERRSDREAEGARLLSEYTPQGYLGFESPLLRQSNVASTGNRACFVFIPTKLGDSNR